MMTTTAVIVGNGSSRKEIDLAELKTLGPLYGCNASYRDFKVDYLIAIDDKIIGEILESSYPRDRFIVPPEDEQYESAEYSPMRRRENAGMVAMREAIKAGHKTLYCLGFDFLFDDANRNMDNIYNNTFGYGPETRASVADCINRVAYLDWFASKYSDVEFIFMYPGVDRDKAFRFVRSKNILIAFIDKKA